MILFDFVIYYFTLWFEKNKQNLSWSTPLERAIYAFTVMCAFWVLSFWQLIEFFILKNKHYHITAVPGLFIGIVMVFLLQYLYISKKRYEFLIEKVNKPFFKNENRGFLICIVFGVISIFLPFILAIVLRKIR